MGMPLKTLRLYIAHKDILTTCLIPIIGFQNKAENAASATAGVVKILKENGDSAFAGGDRIGPYAC